MNYIGIDISKVSTAMVIENNNGEFWFSYNNKKLSNKWNKDICDIVNIKTYEYIVDENYSKSEINKLEIFLKISNDIINDILSVVDDEKSFIYVEGYNYGKNVGPIIDLVGIGGLIRGKLLENVSNLEKIEIIAPTQLKSLCCEMVYGYENVEIGKRVKRIEKVINKNKKGVTGGNFDKFDMYNAIIDYNYVGIMSEYINQKKDEINALKDFPKPLEDLDDAYWLKEVCKNNK